MKSAFGGQLTTTHIRCLRRFICSTDTMTLQQRDQFIDFVSTENSTSTSNNGGDNIQIERACIRVYVYVLFFFGLVDDFVVVLRVANCASKIKSKRDFQ